MPAAQRRDVDRRRRVGRRLQLEAARAALAGEHGRRTSTVSRTFVSGRSNGIWFQRSTITFEDEPMPRQNRPPRRVLQRGRVLGEHAGPR